VYNEDVSIDFSANVAPFSASLSQAIKGLENMSASADSTVARIGKLDNVALAAVKTFGKFLDLNKASTVQAAAYQQKLAGLATVTALNEKQFKGLSDVSLKFAREFPIGLDKSIGMIDTLRTSGVTTTKSIKDLGNAFIKIQAASGEWGSEFVSDMLSVNRSFGGSISSAVKFGDSLVTVSNKFGASASSVTGFTKALAPVASAMGLNATETMGFSTAFSRLGEDGTRAANALGKVMSDLTVSAKTGSPQIQQYASAMNMSADSLRQLVNTDPAEAVIRFTEAISKQGPKAIDTLNRLGIDGIQNFKAIQTLGKSSDIRNILQTGAESFGNGSATKGAKEALGGVNDQMTRLGDTMNQTVAVAGTPFLKLIGGLLSGVNSFADAIHSAVTAVSNLAQKFAPLLAAFKVLHASMTAITLIRFGGFLGKAFTNNTELGRSFAKGRADAAAGSLEEGGNMMYKLGAKVEDNLGGIMGRPLKETLKNVYSGLKGGVGYALAGVMNAQTSMLRGSPEELAPRQLASRNFIENINSAKIGGPIETSKERLAEERINRQRVKRGLDPMPKPDGEQVDFVKQMKGIGSAFKQFGADMKEAGKGARFLGVTAGTSGGELRVAFAALTAATVRATLAVTMQFVKAIGSMVLEMGEAMLPMLAVMAAMQAFTSIKGGTEKSHQLRDEGVKAGLETPGSVYNDFAQKAGLATRNIDSLAVAAQSAAHQLVVNTKSLAEANTITDERIATVQNPAYKAAYDFGKNKSAENIKNQIVNLEGQSPNPQARAQLINDVIKAYGAGTAQQVVNMLAPANADRSGNGRDRERTSKDVYSAGFKDITGNREDRWWSSTYRGLLQLEAVGGTILTLGNKYHALENGIVFNNGMGKYDTEQSKNAMSNLITNISAEAMSAGDIYGARAGKLAELSETSKAYTVGKNQGNYGDVAAVINGLYGTNVKGADVADSNTLAGLLKKTLTDKKATADQKAMYEEMFGDKGYAKGQNLNSPNFMKVFMANAGEDALKKADARDRQTNLNSRGLAGTVYAGEEASKRTGFKLEDLTADSTNDKARLAYLGKGTGKNAKNNLSLTERVAVDAANRPNDPVAQALQGTSIAITAMNNHSNDSVAAMKELTGALHTAADGTTKQTNILAAYNQVQAVKTVNDAGLGSVTKARQAIAIGKEAQAGPLPTNDAEKEIYNQKIDAMNSGYATELSIVKQFVEARNNYNVQIARQNEQYHKTVMRSNRDFNTQLANQDEDYRIGVKRANEEFAISRRRQSEDFAKSVYSPFQRLTAARTADASGLLGNLKQQNKVIKEQMSNVAKLKKMGLSQQAIDTLDLFNPNNAQEVARLVVDFATNKNMIAQTNAEVKTRNKLAAEHESSSLNQAAVRQDQDFDRRMSLSQQDYERNIARAKAQHHRVLSDMRIDLRDSQTYAAEDLTRFGTEVDVTSGTIKTSLEKAFKGLPKVAKDNMSQALRDVTTDVKNWKGPTIHFNSDVSTPRMTSYTKKTGRPTSPPLFDSLIWNGRASAGNWYQDPEYQDYYWKLGRGNTFDVNTGATKDPHLGFAEHKYVYKSDGYHEKRAAGGLITGPGTKTSDSIPAMLSHGEYVVKADAVSKYGVHLLEGINNMNFKSGSYVHGKESKLSAMQGYASSITNHSSTQYDHSTQINGPITVQSQDPNQFMRQMQAKKRFQRLSSPV